MLHSRSMTRAERPAGRTRDERPVWWLFLTAAILTCLGIAIFFANGRRYDFAAFYADGTAWNRGAELYSRANLNPPTATIALFAPLARLPFASAQTVWTVAGILGLLASVRVIARELKWSLDQALTAAALLLTSHAAYMAFAFGQVTWLLLWPATMAWVAYRHDRRCAAGAWFGVLVAVKPMFAVSALVLSWPVWTTAGAVSLSISALALFVTGWPAWLRWIQTGRAVSWIEDPLSASVWGLLARFEQVSRLSDLSIASIAVATGLGAWAVWRALFVTQPDRRLVCAWLLQATVAPLGWIYYLPLAFGPAAASWKNNAVTWTAFCLLCVPLALIEPKPFPVAMGLTYPAALVFAWIAWSGVDDSTAVVSGERRHRDVTRSGAASADRVCSSRSVRERSSSSESADRWA